MKKRRLLAVAFFFGFIGLAVGFWAGMLVHNFADMQRELAEHRAEVAK